MKGAQFNLSKLNKAMDWTYKNFVIYEFSELESTNKTAFELANLGKISDHEIIMAKHQNSGRGRQNRNWVSPVGNLYFSLLLRPQIAAEKISQLSFVGIAALRLAVKNSIAKWPNDLLINEKKVAGLLLESKISEKNCEFVVLGVGVNLVSNPSQTIFPAGNLKDSGIEISPQEMLEKFLDEFERLYQNWLDFGFAGIRRLWLKRAYRLNEKIKLKIDGKEIEGIFVDVDEEGNLLLYSSHLKQPNYDEAFLPKNRSQRLAVSNKISMNQERKIVKISVADVS